VSCLHTQHVMRLVDMEEALPNDVVLPHSCAYTQEASFVPLERLCEVGVNAGDVKKAKEAGFHTVDCLLMVTKKTLHQIKGLSEAKCDKMIEAARQLLPVCHAACIRLVPVDFEGMLRTLSVDVLTPECIMQRPPPHHVHAFSFESH
jgi:hypothetical protein